MFSYKLQLYYVKIKLVESNRNRFYIENLDLKEKFSPNCPSSTYNKPPHTLTMDTDCKYTTLWSQCTLKITTCSRV